MIWSGTGSSSNTISSSNIMSSLKTCHEDQEASPNLPSLSSPSVLFSQKFPHTCSGLVHMNTTGSVPSLHDGSGQENNMAESWSQLLLGGLVGDHQRFSATKALLSNGLENWGDQAATASACMVGMKEEGSSMPQAAYNFYGNHLAGDHEMPAGGAKSQLSQMLLASSPRSCITTNLGSNMLDFSNSVPPELRSHHHSDNSSEVRKERLGDRVTALHQIVSPFGKTDTASVLQETIGYIRFLLGQIEALSYPYIGHGNGTSMQNGPMGQRNPGLFPEYPGQLLNHNNNTGAQHSAGQPDEQQGVNEEAKKDLRSRGLCLVPVSCMSHFGGDNAADYWAPAALGGILR
ncbi:transcription factor bHLH68-like isoform X2 [Phragmites australis]|uniref:transcription factor bHLH68-like isoform X2 n=1 Tax=Phragmites australis TaxID=29695 RepID=UPI002D780D02|nr:transcription factor bHLH68-like isoform X2 [Phragmites australis]